MNGRSSRFGSWTFLDSRLGSNFLLSDDNRPAFFFLAESYKLMLVGGLLVTGRFRAKLRNEVLWNNKMLERIGFDYLQSITDTRAYSPCFL